MTGFPKVFSDVNQWSFDQASGLFEERTTVLNQFEKAYHRVREQEGRILTESEIKNLPYLSKNHPYATEWSLRIRPLKRMIKHLKLLDTKKPILDLGCGNGWFTNHLSNATTSVVLGVDINRVELQQAASSFKNDNLFFCYADIENDSFKRGIFQMITVNGVIQYFPCFEKIISKLLELLVPKGEIHLIDSPFYNLKDVNQARKRSKEYYDGIGEGYFSEFYSHHSWDVLNGFTTNIRYKKGPLRRIYRDSPFPWIIITKD